MHEARGTERLRNRVKGILSSVQALRLVMHIRKTEMIHDVYKRELLFHFFVLFLYSLSFGANISVHLIK
jgi:hypothetical protein